MKLHPKLSLLVLAFLIVGVLTSCEQNHSKVISAHHRSEVPVLKTRCAENAKVNVDLAMAHYGLCDVSQLDSTIWFEIKYHSSDNFMHRKLYQTINRPFLQRDVAIRLVKCSRYLRSRDTSLHLLIYDAVRPEEVQWKMWEALDTIPVLKRVKFVSNPRNKSLHNYGAAVDLTICKSDRKPLDMGAAFDDIRRIAYPSYEAHFLQTGDLTKAQWNNRQLLRKVMKSEKFRNLPTEWWHFNACSRFEAKRKYKFLEKEPIQEP